MNDKAKTLTDMVEELWDREESLSQDEQEFCLFVWGDLSVGFVSVEDEARIRQLYRDKVGNGKEA